MGRRALGAAVLTPAERSKRHREKRKAVAVTAAVTKSPASHEAEIASLRSQLAEQHEERERLKSHIRELEATLAEAQVTREALVLEARQRVDQSRHRAEAAEGQREALRRRVEFMETELVQRVTARQMKLGYSSER